MSLEQKIQGLSSRAPSSIALTPGRAGDTCAWSPSHLVTLHPFPATTEPLAMQVLQTLSEPLGSAPALSMLDAQMISV